MDPTKESCAATAWLLNCGVMITFAPLFAKTFRIYKIFGGRKLNVVKISSTKLLLMCAAIFVIEFMILGVWQAVSPFQPIMTEVMEGSPARVHQYLQCGTTGAGGDVFFAIVVEKGLLFVVGSLLAFSTRRVSSTFNESSQIGVTIYMFVFTISLIAIIIVVTQAIGNVLIALVQVAVIWLSFFTIGMLILPKAMIVFGKNAGGTTASLVGSTRDSSSAFSFLSLDVLDSLPMIGSYVSALRNHLKQVEAKQLTLKNKTTDSDHTGIYKQSRGPNYSLHSADQSRNNSVSVVDRITSPKSSIVARKSGVFSHQSSRAAPQIIESQRSNNPSVNQSTTSSVTHIGLSHRSNNPSLGHHPLSPHATAGPSSRAVMDLASSHDQEAVD